MGNDKPCAHVRGVTMMNGADDTRGPNHGLGTPVTPLDIECVGGLATLLSEAHQRTAAAEARATRAETDLAEMREAVSDALYYLRLCRECSAGIAEVDLRAALARGGEKE